MERVTADDATLMAQASMTVQNYLDEAITRIDATYNTTGYAKAHPELVGAFIQACARDYHTACLLGGLQDAAAHLGETLDNMGTGIECAITTDA
jgi:hypothetical protein